MIARVVWAAVLGALNELDSKPRTPQPQVVVVPVVIQLPTPAPAIAETPALPAVSDPDRGDRRTHQVPDDGLWHLLVRAARHAAAQSEDPDAIDAEHAASLVMTELALEHLEATADIDPEDP